MGTHDTDVVFIDTNLDTHLALVVSDLDTVSDLKKRILSEHPLCFPKIGHIEIHGIKVKRKGYFYHLSDSMLVKSAFGGSNKSWFLTVDASASGECAQNDNAISFPSKRDNFQLLQLETKQDENEEIHVASPCVSEHTAKEAVQNLDAGVKSSGDNDTGVLLPGSVPEIEDHRVVNHELPSLHNECEVDGSGEGIQNEKDPIPSVSVPSAKKKRKIKRKKEDMMQVDIAFVEDPPSFPSKRTSSIQVSQLENKQDEKEEIPVVGSCDLEQSRKEDVQDLDMDVNSSGNNDPDVPETRDHLSVNPELPGLSLERKVDGTNDVSKDDFLNAFIVSEEENRKSVASAKKKHKSKRKKEDKAPNNTSKEDDASLVGTVDYTVQQDIVAVANPSENADKEVIKETEILMENQHTDGPASNKKHKKRKRSLTLDSKEMLKVETASQKDEVQKSDEAQVEKKEPKDQFELNNEKSTDSVEYKLNKVIKDILDSRPPAKKKKKGKEKSGEKSVAHRKLINDFNVDNASHHSLEDQQKIKNSSADQSAEHFIGTRPLRTSEQQGRRKKGKINSSKTHETPVVTSSRKDEKADRSSIHGGGVQEEISEDGLFSKDNSMIKTTIDNMEIGADACKEGIQSTEKRTRNDKNHSDIGIKASDMDEQPMELTGDNENVVLDLCHKNEVGGLIGGAEEGREVSPQNDLKLMLLEKPGLSKEDNTDANIRELNTTSKIMDDSGMTEAVKSEKEKRGMRKAKNSGGWSTLGEGIDLVDASESGSVKSLSATNCDPASGNTETEENLLNQIEGKKTKLEEMQGTILLATDKEDGYSADNAGSLEQIKIKSNAEHMGKRQRKKSNSTSSKSTNKSSKTNLEPVKDSVGLEPSEFQFNSGSNRAAQHLTRSVVEKDDNNLEGPSKPPKVNADQQFSSRKQQHEGNLSDDILVDKVNGSDMHGLEATNKQTHAEAVSSSQQLSSKEELDVLRIQPDKKVPKVHRSRQDSKLSGRSDSTMSSIEEKRKGRVNASGKIMDLEKRREHFPVSNSKLEGSKKAVKNKTGKASGNNVRGVVSKTQEKKSLLAGAIFMDDSSSTSEDEVNNSDATTRTPSDNPLLSDFSDGDSSSGLDSQENGSYGGRSSLKASLSSIKGMPIDHVLRSSSRFKKAKTTASQLEETESQPDFVPDSLADM